MRATMAGAVTAETQPRFLPETPRARSIVRLVKPDLPPRRICAPPSNSRWQDVCSMTPAAPSARSVACSATVSSELRARVQAPDRPVTQRVPAPRAMIGVWADERRRPAHETTAITIAVAQSPCSRQRFAAPPCLVARGLTAMIDVTASAESTFGPASRAPGRTQDGE